MTGRSKWAAIAAIARSDWVLLLLVAAALEALAVAYLMYQAGTAVTLDQLPGGQV